MSFSYPILEGMPKGQSSNFCGQTSVIFSSNFNLFCNYYHPTPVWEAGNRLLVRAWQVVSNKDRLALKLNWPFEYRDSYISKPNILGCNNAMKCVLMSCK